MSANQSDEKQFSRRDFLKTTGVLTGGIIGGSLLGGVVGRNLDTEGEALNEVASDHHANDSDNNFNEARMFFKRQEDFRVLEMAAETIFPEDDNGAGAIGLGAPFFIDRQLSGAWGHNARDYMQGPFSEGAETQGYQSRLNRGDIFLQGIRKIDEISLSNHDMNFYDLEEEQRVEIISEFEEGEVELQGVSSERFFSLLRQAVLEGAYADPLYGGNKDMAGWKMKRHPGTVMSYLQYVEEEAFVELEPVALKDH